MGVNAGSSKVFGWFSNMSSVSGMFNWLGICITAIRFRAGLKAQGIDPKTLPWYSSLQPYAAWWGCLWTVLIILFADWSVFLNGNWDHSSFITNYMPIPVFIILYFGYKFWYKTKIVSADDMDFMTGVSSWKTKS